MHSDESEYLKETARSYAAKKENEIFTYGDYLLWDDGERWELIEGTAYNMSPAPSSEHQKILFEIARKFADFFEDKPCQVFIAPFDVRLPEDDERDESIETDVQPDISVICEKSKIDTKGCKGSPTMVVEVLSPNTSKKDLGEKLLLYEKHGVKEYWVIQPADKTVLIFSQDKMKLYGKPHVYGKEDTIKVSIFEGLEIDMNSVFET